MSDLRHLRPLELCRLLNSGPLGEVLSDRQLRRHRTRAGLRLGTGQSVDLFRYLAWVADEVHKRVPEQLERFFNRYEEGLKTTRGHA